MSSLRLCFKSSYLECCLTNIFFKILLLLLHLTPTFMWGHLQVQCCLGPFKCYVTQMGVGGVKFSGKKRYEGVRFNVIGFTRGWVGVQFPEKKRYVSLNQWPLWSILTTIRAVGKCVLTNMSFSSLAAAIPLQS